MKKNIWIFGMMIYVISANARAPKEPWISFKPHLYLGIGGVHVLSENPPVFVTENDYDITYMEINSLQSKGLSFQSQIRLNLVEASLFSLGYTFWGHHNKYSDDLPELWIYSETPKPLRYNLSFHGACLQIDSPWRFFDDHIAPFIMGSAGSFYGSSKVATYTYDEYMGIIWYNEEETSKYNGWAWMAGAGAVIFKYAYVYSGVTYFLQEDLPGQIFLDFIVGVRL